MWVMISLKTIGWMVSTILSIRLMISSSLEDFYDMVGKSGVYLLKRGAWFFCFIASFPTIHIVMDIFFVDEEFCIVMIGGDVDYDLFNNLI